MAAPSQSVMAGTCERCIAPFSRSSARHDLRHGEPASDLAKLQPAARVRVWLLQNYAQRGGAISVGFAFVNMTLCLFEGNMAAVYGGAVFLAPMVRPRVCLPLPSELCRPCVQLVTEQRSTLSTKACRLTLSRSPFGSAAI